MEAQHHTAILVAMIAIAVPAISALGAACAFVWTKVSDYRRNRFETFHRLLGNLVRGVGDKPFLDEQVATLYELRRFRHYYPMLPRVLRNLERAWSASEKIDDSGKKYLLPEVSSLIADIEGRNARLRWWAPWRRLKLA